jgi:hypothetical protein
MYLLHLAVVQGVIMPLVIRPIGLFCAACGQSHLLQYAVYWVVTFLCAFLLYRYFEPPTPPASREVAAVGERAAHRIRGILTESACSTDSK